MSLQFDDVEEKLEYEKDEDLGNNGKVTNGLALINSSKQQPSSSTMVDILYQPVNPYVTIMETNHPNRQNKKKFLGQKNKNSTDFASSTEILSNQMKSYSSIGPNLPTQQEVDQMRGVNEGYGRVSSPSHLYSSDTQVDTNFNRLGSAPILPTITPSIRTDSILKHASTSSSAFLRMSRVKKYLSVAPKNWVDAAVSLVATEESEGLSKRERLSLVLENMNKSEHHVIAGISEARKSERLSRKMLAQAVDKNSMLEKQLVSIVKSNSTLKAKLAALEEQVTLVAKDATRSKADLHNTTEKCTRLSEALAAIDLDALKDLASRNGIIGPSQSNRVESTNKISETVITEVQANKNLKSAVGLYARENLELVKKLKKSSKDSKIWNDNRKTFENQLLEKQNVISSLEEKLNIAIRFQSKMHSASHHDVGRKASSFLHKTSSSTPHEDMKQHSGSGSTSLVVSPSSSPASGLRNLQTDSTNFSQQSLHGNSTQPISPNSSKRLSRIDSFRSNKIFVGPASTLITPKVKSKINLRSIKDVEKNIWESLKISNDHENDKLKAISLGKSLKGITKIVSDINSFMEIEDIESAVRVQLTMLLDCERVNIWHYNHTFGYLWCRLKKDGEIKYLTNLNEGPIGYSLCNIENINDDSPYNDLRFSMKEYDAQFGFKTKSLICQPIMNNDKISSMGILEIANKKNSPAFTEEEEILISIVTEQLSNILKNANVTDLIKKESDFLESLNNLSDTLLGAASLNVFDFNQIDFAKQIEDSARNILKTPYVRVFLINMDPLEILKQNLDLPTKKKSEKATVILPTTLNIGGESQVEEEITNFSEKELNLQPNTFPTTLWRLINDVNSETFVSVLNKLTFDVRSGGLAGAISQSGLPEIINDFHKDHRFNSSIDLDIGKTMMYVVPIVDYYGNVLGVLQVSSNIVNINNASRSALPTKRENDKELVQVRLFAEQVGVITNYFCQLYLARKQSISDNKRLIEALFDEKFQQLKKIQHIETSLQEEMNATLADGYYPTCLKLLNQIRHIENLIKNEGHEFSSEMKKYLQECESRTISIKKINPKHLLVNAEIEYMEERRTKKVVINVKEEAVSSASNMKKQQRVTNGGSLLQQQQQPPPPPPPLLKENKKQETEIDQDAAAIRIQAAMRGKRDRNSTKQKKVERKKVPPPPPPPRSDKHDIGDIIEFITTLFENEDIILQGSSFTAFAKSIKSTKRWAAIKGWLRQFHSIFNGQVDILNEGLWTLFEVSSMGIISVCLSRLDTLVKKYSSKWLLLLNPQIYDIVTKANDEEWSLIQARFLLLHRRFGENFRLYSESKIRELIALPEEEWSKEIIRMGSEYNQSKPPPPPPRNNNTPPTGKPPSRPPSSGSGSNMESVNDGLVTLDNKDSNKLSSRPPSAEGNPKGIRPPSRPPTAEEISKQPPKPPSRPPSSSSTKEDVAVILTNTSVEGNIKQKKENMNVTSEILVIEHNNETSDSNLIGNNITIEENNYSTLMVEKMINNPIENGDKKEEILNATNSSIQNETINNNEKETIDDEKETSNNEEKETIYNEEKETRKKKNSDNEKETIRDGKESNDNIKGEEIVDLNELKKEDEEVDRIIDKNESKILVEESIAEPLVTATSEKNENNNIEFSADDSKENEIEHKEAEQKEVVIVTSHATLEVETPILPKNAWKLIVGEDNQRYYLNEITHETSWTLPLGMEHNSTTPHELPSGWSEMFDNTANSVYYYNATSGETSWTWPALGEEGTMKQYLNADQLENTDAQSDLLKRMLLLKAKKQQEESLSTPFVVTEYRESKEMETTSNSFFLTGGEGGDEENIYKESGEVERVDGETTLNHSKIAGRNLDAYKNKKTADVTFTNSNEGMAHSTSAGRSLEDYKSKGRKEDITTNKEEEGVTHSTSAGRSLEAYKATKSNNEEA